MDTLYLFSSLIILDFIFLKLLPDSVIKIKHISRMKINSFISILTYKASDFSDSPTSQLLQNIHTDREKRGERSLTLLNIAANGHVYELNISILKVKSNLNL